MSGTRRHAVAGGWRRMQSTVDETRRDETDSVGNNAARAGQVAIDFLADVLQSQVLGKV